MRSPALLACFCVLGGLAGCPGPAQHGPAPVAPIQITRSAPAALPTLPDADVVARSRAFFDDLDRTDLDGFAAAVGPTFALYRHGRYYDAALVREKLAARRDRHAPVRSRTWSDARVRTAPGLAIYIAEAVEHVPAEGDQPAADIDGYDTLIWSWDGTRWVVAHWAWTPGGVDAERQVWNDVFEKGVGFRREPNRLLVEAVKGVRPGQALDLLMGQGRNAIYLASQGWKVTGVDISDGGIRIAREAAARRKLTLDAIEADVDHYDLGTARWDLVTMIYAGTDAALVRRAQASLRRGGLFVLEYFHADSKAAKAGAGGWKTGELAALFKGYEILRDDVVDDTADYSLTRQKLVRFVARKP